MEVDGDSSFFEFKVWVFEGAVNVMGIPAVIHGTVGHGVAGEIAVFCSFDDSWDALYLVDLDEVVEPFVAYSEASSFESEIDITTAPEAFFFDGDGVVNEAVADFPCWSIDSANEDEGEDVGFGKRFTAAEVGVGKRAAEVFVFNGKEGELRVNRGAVLSGEGVGFFTTGLLFGGKLWCGLWVVDFVWDTAHEDGATDFVLNGLGAIFSSVLACPPCLFIKDFNQWIADKIVVCGAANDSFIRWGDVERDEVFGRNLAFLGVGFGQFLRLGEVLIINDDELFWGEGKKRGGFREKFFGRRRRG